MKLRQRTIAASVWVGLVVAGCTAPAFEQARARASSAPSATTVWKTEVQLVGSPRVAADTIVSLLRRDGELRVGAWRLSDGKQLWSAPATTSGEAPGIELSVETVTVDDHAFVAYLRPHKASEWAEMVIADVRTGRATKGMPIVIWPMTPPRPCGDEESFCLVGYRLSNWIKRVNLRIDPISGRVGIDHGDGLPPSTRWVGNSLYASDARPPDGIEQLGWVRNSKSVWERPYSSVFGEGYSSDFGWAWDEDEDGLSVGFGNKEDCRTSEAHGETTRTCEATSGRLVALNSATGATVWSLDRVDECQGHGRIIMSTQSEIATCRNLVDTEVSRKQGEDWTPVISTNEQELVVVDRQTGAVVWRVPLGKTADPASSPVYVDSESRVVLTAAGQPTIYGIENHSSTPVGADARLMCRRDRPALRLAWMGSTKRYRYSIGEDVEPCDPAGKPIDSIPADWVPAAGIDAGDGRWLLPTPGSLTLVQLG